MIQVVRGWGRTTIADGDRPIAFVVDGRIRVIDGRFRALEGRKAPPDAPALEKLFKDVAKKS
ncbi:MAG: hypothetical protein EBR82_43950 [Caulobacteraceae bacterium]|nr:hypothetical protein [Caulobacteraceae bacterium]